MIGEVLPPLSIDRLITTSAGVDVGLLVNGAWGGGGGGWGCGGIHGALRPQKPVRLIRDGEVGGGGSGILYITPTRYTVITRMILH